MGTFPTRKTDSGAVVIAPVGKVNLATAPALRAELHAVVAGGGHLVVVDLTDVDFIDSSGIGVLISGLKAAREADGDLRIAAPNSQVVKVLELTHLTRVLIPHESVEDALAGRADLD